jgi:transketolase
VPPEIHVTIASAVSSPTASHGIAHDDMANAIRALAMDAVEKAKSGHPGMPMGMADVATVLFTRFLKFDPAHSEWPDRDRFVLSAGHGSMLLYALLHLTGYADMTMEEIRNFRQLGSRTPGHPEHGVAAGVETTTGPLGQGLANAVGMALAERMLAERFGAGLVDHCTYCLVGDGCLMEGISHEAISLAGHLRLNKLIVLFDDNHISIDGPTELAVSDDQPARFRAAGWNAQTVDGHDPEAVGRAIAAAKQSSRPSLIACRTTIARGAPTKAGTAASHGSPLGTAEIEGARKNLNWPHAPFVVPEPIVKAWRAAGSRGATAYAAWAQRHGADKRAADFDRVVTGALPDRFANAVEGLKKELAREASKTATRQTSGRVLDVLMGVMPELVGGSADLTGSNLTKAKSQGVIAHDRFGASYVHYGVREHAMGAAMNGIALHGGFIPYGGSFLSFTDYARPAIRLSALMELRVVYVMTHDSIGLGEDGPTHQPVEHLAALRAIPNLQVFRPADPVETAECWALALASRKAPSVIALTRQAVPTVRTRHDKRNLSAFGGYVLAKATGRRKATVMATGSEIGVAMEARQRLEAEGVPTAVVSMPCWSLFDRQPQDYRDRVLGRGRRVAVEAGVALGWERYLGAKGAFVGMTGFGASAPYEALYRHFGITADAVVAAVKAGL